jgi:hypothetical protein
MKLGVIMAMALAALAATDSASAAGRRNASHAQQASSEGVAGGSFTSKKLVSPKTTQPTTKGIIMRDGGVCDPIRHMGC